MSDKTIRIPEFSNEITFNAFVDKITDDTKFLFDVYISGPMSGMDKHNFPAFNSISGRFRSVGLRVFNPAENFNGVTDLARSTYLRKDIEILTKCKSIIFIEGWTKSRGAKLEALVARELDLLMFEYKPLMTFYELK